MKKVFVSAILVGLGITLAVLSLSVCVREARADEPFILTLYPAGGVVKIVDLLDRASHRKDLPKNEWPLFDREWDGQMNELTEVILGGSGKGFSEDVLPAYSGTSKRSDELQRRLVASYQRMPADLKSRFLLTDADVLEVAKYYRGKPLADDFASLGFIQEKSASEQKALVQRVKQLSVVHDVLDTYFSELAAASKESPLMAPFSNSQFLVKLARTGQIQTLYDNIPPQSHAEFYERIGKALASAEGSAFLDDFIKNKGISDAAIENAIRTLDKGGPNQIAEIVVNLAKSGLTVRALREKFDNRQPLSDAEKTAAVGAILGSMDLPASAGVALALFRSDNVADQVELPAPVESYFLNRLREKMKEAYGDPLTGEVQQGFYPSKGFQEFAGKNEERVKAAAKPSVIPPLAKDLLAGSALVFALDKMAMGVVNKLKGKPAGTVNPLSAAENLLNQGKAAEEGSRIGRVQADEYRKQAEAGRQKLMTALTREARCRAWLGRLFNPVSPGMNRDQAGSVYNAIQFTGKQDAFERVRDVFRSPETKTVMTATTSEARTAELRKLYEKLENAQNFDELLKAFVELSGKRGQYSAILETPMADLHAYLKSNIETQGIHGTREQKLTAGKNRARGIIYSDALRKGGVVGLGDPNGAFFKELNEMPLHRLSLKEYFPAREMSSRLGLDEIEMGRLLEILDGAMGDLRDGSVAENFTRFFTSTGEELSKRLTTGARSYMKDQQDRELVAQVFSDANRLYQLRQGLLDFYGSKGAGLSEASRAKLKQIAELTRNQYKTLLDLKTGNIPIISRPVRLENEEAARVVNYMLSQYFSSSPDRAAGELGAFYELDAGRFGQKLAEVALDTANVTDRRFAKFSKFDDKKANRMKQQIFGIGTLDYKGYPLERMMEDSDTLVEKFGIAVDTGGPLQVMRVANEYLTEKYGAGAAVSTPWAPGFTPNMIRAGKAAPKTEEKPDNGGLFQLLRKKFREMPYMPESTSRTGNTVQRTWSAAYATVLAAGIAGIFYYVPEARKKEAEQESGGQGMVGVGDLYDTDAGVPMAKKVFRHEEVWRFMLNEVLKVDGLEGLPGDASALQARKTKENLIIANDPRDANESPESAGENRLLPGNPYLMLRKGDKVEKVFVADTKQLNHLVGDMDPVAKVPKYFYVINPVGAEVILFRLVRNPKTGKPDGRYEIAHKPWDDRFYSAVSWEKELQNPDESQIGKKIKKLDIDPVGLRAWFSPD